MPVTSLEPRLVLIDVGQEPTSLVLLHLEPGAAPKLAGVVAHEMGHVEGRHIAYRMESAGRANLAALAALLAGAPLNATIAALLARPLKAE